LSDKAPIKKIPAALSEDTVPADLTVALVWLAASILAIYLPVLNETPIKAILILPGILFFPGYCLIATLFPKKEDISLSERIALSIGLSIAIVPLIGLALNFTPFGIQLDSIVISLTLFILVMILVAHYRRSLLPREKRFGFPFYEIAGTIRNSMFPTEGSKVDRVLAVVITLAFLASILGSVYVFTVPYEGERFTDFFILGENGMASDYPDLILVGQNYSLFIGVGNHEYRNMTYTLETWTVLTEFDTLTNSTTIIAMDPLDRQSLVLSHNETRNIPYNLSLNKTNYNRVEFLLFNETVPGPKVTGSDRINASYRDLHLWVTIKDAGFQKPSN
jgi:uncharacterized membrane protein